MIAITTAALAAAMALGTWLAGWLAIPVVAFAYGLVGTPSMRSVTVSALGAGLAWGGVIVIRSFSQPVGELARRVGGIFGSGAIGFLALTIVFAVTLAATATWLGLEVRPRGLRQTRGTRLPSFFGGRKTIETRR